MLSASGSGKEREYGCCYVDIHSSLLLHSEFMMVQHFQLAATAHCVGPRRCAAQLHWRMWLYSTKICWCEDQSLHHPSHHTKACSSQTSRTSLCVFQRGHQSRRIRNFWMISTRSSTSYMGMMAAGTERSIHHNNIFKHPSGERPDQWDCRNPFLFYKFILDWTEARAYTDVHLHFPFPCFSGKHLLLRSV